MFYLFRILRVPIISFCATLAGCYDLSVSSTPTDAVSKNSSLSVLLKTNAQYPISKDRFRSFDKVFLKVDSVKTLPANKSGADEADWIALEVPGSIRGRPVDFVSYTQSSLMLASQSLVPGAYKKIRLTFSPNQIVDSYRNYVNLTKVNRDTGIRTSQEALIDFPSDNSRILEMPINFNMTKDASATIGITLDLRSIFEKTQGNFFLNPVATAFEQKNTGSITLDAGSSNGSVVVTAQREGKIVRRMILPAAVGNTTILLDQLPKTSDGGRTENFDSNPSNSYQVVFVSEDYPTKIIKNIPVKPGETTNLSSFQIRFSLPEFDLNMGVFWEPSDTRTDPDPANSGLNSSSIYTAELVEYFGSQNGSTVNSMPIIKEFTSAIQFRLFQSPSMSSKIPRSFFPIPGLYSEILDYSDSKGFVQTTAHYVESGYLGVNTNSDFNNKNTISLKTNSSSGSPYIDRFYFLQNTEY